MAPEVNPAAEFSRRRLPLAHEQSIFAVMTIRLQAMSDTALVAGKRSSQTLEKPPPGFRPGMAL
jgi:hypothetical protein